MEKPETAVQELRVCWFMPLPYAAVLQAYPPTSLMVTPESASRTQRTPQRHSHLPMPNMPPHPKHSKQSHTAVRAETVASKNGTSVPDHA
jgi:hypothetical protein